jgi:DNA-binding GntR family transcriptional regulator
MPVPPRAVKLRRLLAREEVYAQIRAWILEGEMAPGERIQDAALAEALGVSRMPVREALLRLQSEGLVESSANRWIRVTPIRVELGAEIYPLIWTLEGMALRQVAASLTEEHLAAMDAEIEHLRRAIAARDHHAAHDADTAFHALILDATRNAQLIQIVADLKTKLRRLEIVELSGNLRSQASIDEHEAIVAALRRGDVEVALHELDLNWRHGFDRFRAHLAAQAAEA